MKVLYTLAKGAVGVAEVAAGTVLAVGGTAMSLRDWNSNHLMSHVDSAVASGGVLLAAHGADNVIAAKNDLSDMLFGSNEDGPNGEHTLDTLELAGEFGDCVLID